MTKDEYKTRLASAIAGGAQNGYHHLNFNSVFSFPKTCIHFLGNLYILKLVELWVLGHQLNLNLRDMHCMGYFLLGGKNAHFLSVKCLFLEYIFSANIYVVSD